MGRWVVICPCMWRTIPVFLVAASGSISTLQFWLIDWPYDLNGYCFAIYHWSVHVCLVQWPTQLIVFLNDRWSLIGLSNCQLRLTKYPRSRCFRATAGHLATVAAVCVAMAEFGGKVEASVGMLSSQSLRWVFIGENSRIWHLDDFQASQIYMFFFLGSDRTTFFSGTPFILFTFSHLCSVGLWWLPRSSSLGRPWFFVPWRLWRSCWPAAVHLGDGTKRRHIRNANHQSFIAVSSLITHQSTQTRRVQDHNIYRFEAFSVLSPTRTVRATALRGAASAGTAAGAGAGAATAGAGVLTLCGAAALRRKSGVACCLGC